MMSDKYSTERDKSFIQKVNKTFPDQESKDLVLVTLLGASGVLAEFVIKNHQVNDMPFEVSYACSLVAANMIALINDQPVTNVRNMAKEFGEYEMSEQTQERIYRAMKEVVLGVYKFIQEQDEVNNG